MKTEALVHLEVMLRRERLDVDATPVVLISGAPAEAILEHAEHSGADLLLAGTHGRSGWSGLLLGSVAQKLVRSARCPVLIAHAPDLEMVPAPEQRRSSHVAAVGTRPKPEK